MNSTIETYLSEQKKNVDFHLSQVLKTLGEKTPKLLHQAIAYSLLSPGKRLRPILTLAACESVKGDSKSAWPLACAIEMIHCYSLIQDDLPCMDNDDFRRGQLTNHRVFGEGLALLASDALLTEAVLVLNRAPLDPEIRNQLIEEIFSASGAGGMIGGQALDLGAIGTLQSKSDLMRLHELKTGALFCASIRGGALVGRASPESLNALTQFAKLFGLAFQVIDDVLDATSTLKNLGKNPAGDQRLGKKTFVDLLGIEEAKKYATEVMDQGLRCLLPLGSSAERLRALASMVLQRV